MSQKTQKHQCITIDGKALAEEILHKVRKKIVEEGRAPGLAVVLVGDDPSSKLYIRNKERACQKVGIEFHKYFCNGAGEKKLSQKEIIKMIRFLNKDESISGIIVQLPLPQGYDTDEIISAIDPDKDADGFHPKNIKKILSQKTAQLPPLIKTILHILESIKMESKGKRVCVLSKSDIFRQVIVKALEDRGARVNAATLAEALTKKYLQEADIVISILGKPKAITSDMIKKGAAIIDIGITKTENGFFGDVDFESIIKVAKFATPTPGGVGPITVAMLLDSVFELAQKQ